MKTVKEVSILSGVSVRTLHHYDKIGLFPPTALSEAGYRLYDDEAKEKWGQTAAYQEFAQKHASDDFAQISQEMAKIMVQFGQLKTQNVSDESVQMCVKRLQDYISQHFYTCTNEILAGLGQMYQSDDRFSQSIDKAGGAGTSEFVSQAIAYYCQ
ncbi:TipAS antibiotic-recognition domain-containing protein [Streptococcus agalactiae]